MTTTSPILPNALSVEVSRATPPLPRKPEGTAAPQDPTSKPTATPMDAQASQSAPPSSPQSAHQTLIKQRIALLEQRLKTLETMASAGLIPSRQVSQIAKELKGLVSQYASLGTDGGQGVAAEPSSASNRSAENAETLAKDTEESASSRQAEVMREALSIVNEAQTMTDRVNSAGKSSGDRSLVSRDSSKGDSTDVVAAETALNALSLQGLSSDDSTFIAKLKVLAQRITNMAMQIREQDSPSARSDYTEMRKALAEMMKSIAAAEKALLAESQTGEAETLYDPTGTSIELHTSTQISINI